MAPKPSRKRAAPKSGNVDDAEIDSKLAAVDLLGALLTAAAFVFFHKSDVESQS